MGQARATMDSLTEAYFERRFDRAEALYAPDAIGVTPDGTELKGGHEIVSYMRTFLDAFPDARYEVLSKVEAGSVAVDEGRFIGTNDAPIVTPTLDIIPATHKHISLRGCDVLEVDHGLVRSHRFYFDQVDMLTQLGLMPPQDA